MNTDSRNAPLPQGGRAPVVQQPVLESAALADGNVAQDLSCSRVAERDRLVMQAIALDLDIPLPDGVVEALPTFDPKNIFDLEAIVRSVDHPLQIAADAMSVDLISITELRQELDLLSPDAARRRLLSMLATNEFIESVSEFGQRLGFRDAVVAEQVTPNSFQQNLNRAGRMLVQICNADLLAQEQVSAALAEHVITEEYARQVLENPNETDRDVKLSALEADRTRVAKLLGRLDEVENVEVRDGWRQRFIDASSMNAKRRQLTAIEGYLDLTDGADFESSLTGDAVLRNEDARRFKIGEPTLRLRDIEKQTLRYIALTTRVSARN